MLLVCPRMFSLLFSRPLILPKMWSLVDGQRQAFFFQAFQTRELNQYLGLGSSVTLMGKPGISDPLMLKV